MNIAAPYGRILFAIVAFLVLAADARSEVVLTVDPAQSTVDAQLVVSVVSDTENLQFSGTMNSNILLAMDPTYGLVADTVEVTSADLGLSDGAWLLSFLFFVNVSVDTTGLRATASSSAILGTPVAMNTSEFELQGSLLSFNEGSVVAVGDALGSPVNIDDDLSVAPLVFPFEESTIATVVVTDLGDGTYNVEIAIPVEASVIALEDPEVVTLNLSNGQMVLNGTLVEMETPLPIMDEWRFLGLIPLFLLAGFAVLRYRRQPLTR